MSAAPTPEDLRASSTLLNTLHAEHQGAFARASLLTRLGLAATDPPAVAVLQERLADVAAGAQRLWAREPLLFADGRTDDEGGLARALEWLDDLCLRAERVGRGLEAALDALQHHDHRTSARPEAGIVLGALAWAAYAWDHELRGVIHFGETLEQPELADQARRQLPHARQSLELLHHLLQRLDAEDPPGCGLVDELRRAAAHLPGVFGAKADALAGLANEIRGLRA